jgi:hypothetical protein
MENTNTTTPAPTSRRRSDNLIGPKANILQLVRQQQREADARNKRVEAPHRHAR